MGIAVKDLLATEYFKDYKVIAGKKGLSREIQGVTLFEAPDGLRWAKGKELILSSGYVISMNPGIIEKAFKEGSIQVIAALMIKEQRYIDIISDDLKALFDEYEIPLITMPFFHSWMEVMSKINTVVLNRIMRRFNINGVALMQSNEKTYKDQKIKRILEAVEEEMNFPVALFDMTEEITYVSSGNFEKMASKYGVSGKDFWEADNMVSRSTLCDYTGMMRFRLYNNEAPDEARVSWIHIPIIVNNIVVAHFVVLESREFIDYYDEYSIRVAYLMLQGTFEQLNYVQNAGNIGFENLVQLAMNYEENDKSKLVYQANAQGISLSSTRYCVLFKIEKDDGTTEKLREPILQIFNSCRISAKGRLAFVAENEGYIVVKCNKNEVVEKEQATELIKEFDNKIKLIQSNISICYAIVRTPVSIAEFRDSAEKCRAVMRTGKILYPDTNIWDYEMLGPLTWLNIPEKELEKLLGKYRKLLDSERNEILLKTLKCYLDNNMVFNTTAEKMYVHINTIRKRMIQISEIIDVNLDDPVERIKLQILLNYLGL